MTDQEARKLYGELKALGVKIDNLTELFNHAAHGDGFSRCAAHRGRIRQVEKSVELCHARVSGVKRWLIAGVVSAASLLANFVWNMLTAR